LIAISFNIVDPVILIIPLSEAIKFSISIKISIGRVKALAIVLSFRRVAKCFVVIDYAKVRQSPRFAW